MSRFQPFKVIDLYKYKNTLLPSGTLFPVSTDFDFWDDVYTDSAAEYDREFARKYKNFLYFDFLEGETESESLANFKLDVLSILTFNQKRYEELYRVFVVTDEDDPLTYNYDMTETTGAQKQTNTKGEQQNTIGSHTDTIGEQTNTHSVAPYNTADYVGESQDVAAQRQDTIGSHTDTEGTREDTIETDEWTLTRRGNLGVMTATDMLEKHQNYWTHKFEFMQLIFEDICKQLLLVGGI